MRHPYFPPLPPLAPSLTPTNTNPNSPSSPVATQQGFTQAGERRRKGKEGENIEGFFKWLFEILVRSLTFWIKLKGMEYVAEKLEVVKVHFGARRGNCVYCVESIMNEICRRVNKVKQ